MSKPRLVYGFGVNDANYPVTSRVNGRQVCCRYYQTWRSMLHRCYGKKSLKYNQAYIGCSVTSEWKFFSKFKSWMERQSWQGYELDKDLKCLGNRVYSPECCLFVPKVVNNFWIGQEEVDRGVTYDATRKKTPWRARCGSGTRKGRWTAYFPTKQDARIGYLKYKIQLGEQILAGLQSPEVAVAFKARLVVLQVVLQEELNRGS